MHQNPCCWLRIFESSLKQQRFYQQIFWSQPQVIIQGTAFFGTSTLASSFSLGGYRLILTRGSIGIDSLMEPTSRSNSRNCSFLHFLVGFIFSLRGCCLVKTCSKKCWAGGGCLSPLPQLFYLSSLFTLSFCSSFLQLYQTSIALSFHRSLYSHFYFFYHKKNDRVRF